MFPSQSAPKVFLNPSKDNIFIMELHKLHKTGRILAKSLGNKTQPLNFWNSYS